MPSYRQADNTHTSKASSNCVKCGKWLKTVSLEGWHLDLDSWFPAGGNVLRVWETFKKWNLTGEGGSWGLHWLCFLSVLWFLSYPDVIKQPSTPATMVWAVSSTLPSPPCYLQARSQGQGTRYPLSGFWWPCVRYSVLFRYSGMREVPNGTHQGWRVLKKAF